MEESSNRFIALDKSFEDNIKQRDNKNKVCKVFKQKRQEKLDQMNSIKCQTKRWRGLEPSSLRGLFSQVFISRRMHLLSTTNSFIKQKIRKLEANNVKKTW